MKGIGRNKVGYRAESIDRRPKRIRELDRRPDEEVATGEPRDGHARGIRKSGYRHVRSIGDPDIAAEFFQHETSVRRAFDQGYPQTRLTISLRAERISTKVNAC
jgi:hypothetical protein